MKTVLITGCSSGFGFELVGRFLERNWRVIATMRNLRDRAMIFDIEKQRYGDQLILFELDVTSSSDRSKIYAHLDRAGIPLDCLVNNAGYGLFGAFEDLSEAQIRAQFEVNVFGLMLLTQQILPLIRKTRGRILNISSVVGYTGVPFTSMYSASKFAVEGFSESLAYDLIPFGVQVCLIEPGRHRTHFSKKLSYGEKALDPFSPYFRFTKRFKDYRDKGSEGPGIPSYHVVDRVVRLAEASRIPLRCPVGTDAWAAYLLKKILPSSIFHWILGRAFRHAFFDSI